MDHRHMKRHSRKDTLGLGHDRSGPAMRPSPSSEATAVNKASSDGPLTTVTEEENGYDDELGSANSAVTFALTSKHLLATSDSRSSYHGTKDLNFYQTLCQQKKSLSHVLSPYHAMESVHVQHVKAASKTSEVDSEDTGYKSATSSFASHEMQVRHRKSTETSSSKHKERVNTFQRIPIQNPRPPSDPMTLAALLIEKLEQVRRSQDSAQGDQYRSREDLEKEDAQSILDDHISRVFGDSSGELSPREKVSSWVMDTKKYCDMQMDDDDGVDEKDKRFKGFVPMDTSESTHHRRSRRLLDASNRLGSIDEGLGRSINSLANSASIVGQSCSSISSIEDGSLARSANDMSRRTLLQSRNLTANHEQSKLFSNMPSLKSTKKMPSSAPQTAATSTVTSSCPREMISVVYQIVGEALPYLSKVAGTQLTLKQLKAVVPRKGKYRYFLQRTCEDLDVGAVFEEITDDNETLPFWEGKISARLEPVD